MSYVYSRERPMLRAFSFMNGNAAAHFRLRASTWAMAIIDLVVGLFMVADPNMLTGNPGANVYFSHLVSWVAPEGWRNLFVFIGILRLAALYVNGTYRSIWWTPHIRLATAFVSFILWGQFAISVLASGFLTIGSVLYCATVVVEGFNIAVASTETKFRPEG